MGSGPRAPRARHRFGFSGPVRRPKGDRLSTDDILDSLTRQAERGQKLGEKGQVRPEEVVETKDLGRFQAFNPEPASALETAEKRSGGCRTLVCMLLLGLTVGWLYSSSSNPFDLALLKEIIQKLGAQSIFENLAQFGTIVIAATVATLWIRRRRRGSSLRLLSS